MANLSMPAVSVALALMLALGTAEARVEPVSGTPADAGIVNKERVLYWLIKRGELSADASAAQQDEAVAAFVARAQGIPKDMRAQLARERASKISAQRNKAQFSAVAPLNASAIAKTVKVLGVLVDFPDLPHDANRLSPSDTDMYYSSYPVSHYRNLLFSTTGFAGPSNQNLISANQYYSQVSGSTFSFTGDVLDWVRADNNAAYYGGNDPANEDNDKAVPELVLEAVTKAVAGLSAAQLASYDVEDPYDLDGDGNLNEADGIIDHVMLFHSSIGEEAGGGVLGDDAIWSHRFFVNSGGSETGVAIPGTSKRVFGYTVQPIDAAAGVCTHEFGHDLGLPDEYDTSNSGDGSPVGAWSLMSGGSWTGVPAGSKPSGFSPYARSFLQQQYQGNWLNEQVVTLSSLNSAGTDYNLVEAVNSVGVNQISIPLPAEDVPFKAPYSGSFQYYSGQGNMLNHAMTFSLALPVAASITLKMKANWDIETDYDYMQLRVDSTAIAGNHTKASNGVNTAKNIITGKSANIAGAEGADAWVELTYDLSAYAGMTKQISFVYKTDDFVGGYGIAIDDIAIVTGSSTVYSDDAETDGKMNLSGGFSRIGNTRPGKDRRYIIQLRSHNGVDQALGDAGYRYDAGVLMWLEDFNQDDNNVSDHPGKVLIGVIDADQNLIGSYGTEVQIRDAAFSKFNQTTFAGDSNLAAVTLFDDSLDYSAPLKPMAGLILPHLGLTMEVIQQATNSSTATIRLSLNDGNVPEPTPLTADFTSSASGATVNFSANVSGGTGSYSYAWDFGVSGATSNLRNPSYSYAASGTYTVSLTVSDGGGNNVTVTRSVTVSIPVVAAFTSSVSSLTASFSNGSSGGSGNLSYAWSFGDGQSSTAINPSHTYSAAGSYTVTLTVTDSQGSSNSVSHTVTVTAPTNLSNGGSSGGGSLGWLSLGLLSLLGWRRRQ
ncbi:immune inhibitor A domain-containing protein [Shewanella sedimentimangrovi]|nr:immune inhibitor A domain-containing protein [Shewanella sedimentimangrovi]